MNKLIKLKKFVTEKIEIIRQKISSNPKIIIWRLKLFGFHPFLGKHSLKIVGIILAIIFIYFSFYITVWRSPRPFPSQTLLSIERGENLSQIANFLQEKKIILSPFWLKTFVIFWGGEKKAVAGDYYFPKAINVFKVAKMISKGEFGLIAQKITLPEGSSSIEMAEILKKELPSFKTDDFINEVANNNYEGYLFPDTYFLTPNTKVDDLILMMRENFVRQLQEYREDIDKLDKPLNEIVIVASIIEEEANNSLDTKRTISGILWNRLRLGMALQVDAPFVYYNGKNSYTLTKEDMVEDHSYNTYINKGLPPTAITNPGIDSLRAAIAPNQTNYFYFMSDKYGNIYYAKDFEGHKKNREMYLD
ncbi:MAG: hypothetical protein COV33_01860 [Candidatus Zambryskibacteria bacterium CG10_big_fil_rev_8_21_14_0_10_34_34]|uniref:Endolytic murein transglycosylase n=1 Tax=Candidatus Zambryskibacteria bacterium CG10_big_fil_rev_8_21_14_0_10_34_34 TaxID=1975114 RepID=A0A2H0R0N0_9BACT|nr:MAG: hypothetical protein COV33_01860 [Candidatus Zambryskibacteria bacterium CG10_big_fil_rev_8_21_14_0_10_34_34]